MAIRDSCGYTDGSNPGKDREEVFIKHLFFPLLTAIHGSPSVVLGSVNGSWLFSKTTSHVFPGRIQARLYRPLSHCLATTETKFVNG